MNEYMVSVYISKNRMSSNVIVEADDKDEAIAKAKAKCEAEGFTVYGYDYCDFMG